MHLYNACLPPQVTENTKTESNSFKSVVRSIIDSYNPQDPDSIYSTLKWISVIVLRKKFQVKKEDSVGHGAYGVVMKGFYKSKGMEVVAVKTVKKEEAADGFKREVELLFKAQGEGVIKVYGIIKEKKKIVMEYAEGGNLKNVLDSYPCPLDNVKIIRFAASMSKTMQRLHSVNIVHRDLKPENYVLNKEMTKIMLCDFGSARVVDKHMTPCIGTIEFMAPEAQTEVYNHKIDVYSFGKLFWQMLMKKLPPVQDEVPTNDIDQPLASLIIACLKDADERIDFKAITQILEDYLSKLEPGSSSSSAGKSVKRGGRGKK